MKPFYLALLTVAFLSFISCSKQEAEPEQKIEQEDNTVKLSNIKFDRDNVGVGQMVDISIDEPSGLGAIVTYKWTVKDPEGKAEDFVVYVPKLEYYVEEEGKYEVLLNISSGIKTGSTEGGFESRATDFGVAIFGNSSKIIKDAKEADGKTPDTGLAGFYWPYDTQRPRSVVRYLNGSWRENYLFDEDKFVGGTIELIEGIFASQVGTFTRNFSYYQYLERAVGVLDKLFGQEGQTTFEWRSGTTEERILWYKNDPIHEYDGYGWALMNRDLLEIKTVWDNGDKEGVAIVKALPNNSRYEVKAIIRKK